MLGWNGSGLMVHAEGYRGLPMRSALNALLTTDMSFGFILIRFILASVHSVVQTILRPSCDYFLCRLSLNKQE
jgi:hypothetical protein